MSAPAKLLFVGLDAADRDHILRWADEGRLPTLRRLLDRGVSATTLAPLGMHAASVWHSFFTAVTPARHGRHGDRQVRPGTYEMYRFWPSDTKREAFWNALSRAQRRVAVIDVPYVAPSKDLNGIHVVDWTSHAMDSGFCTTPPELAREICRRFGHDPVGLCDHRPMRTAAEFAAFRDALVAKVSTKVALSRHFLARGGWDLFLTVFGESHCAGHQCWHLSDPGHPRFDAEMAATVGNPMLDVYRALDGAIGQLLEDAGAPATVFVLATHGMGPFYNGAHLLGEILARLGHTPPPPAPSQAWALLRWGWRRLPARLRARLTPLHKAAVDRVWPDLDPRANCFDMPNGEVYGAIRLNLVGREPAGRIHPGAESEAFCEQLTRDLRALVNVDTGRAVVRRVLRTAELYQGPYLDDLPDLLVEWNSEAPLSTVQSPKTGIIERVFDGTRTGHHKREGLLIACGPGIKPARLPEPVSIMDVAPTVAALLGVTLPDVDGRPIAACLEEKGCALAGSPAPARSLA